jgi:Rps23 Pro-64 3,4-dihydroxylase Tpa1-like proline 4-hydroxylase
MLKISDADKLENDFKKNKIALISDFFSIEFAEKLRNDLVEQHLQGFDYATSYPRSPRQPHMGIINTPENQQIISDEYKIALENFEKHDTNWYLRFFYRISTTGVNSTPTIRKIRDNLENPLFVNIIKKITGIPELYFLYAEPFVYTKGCFLGIHTDSPKQNRAVAIVIHLSENWSQDDGGVYFYTTSENQVGFFVPKFNTAVITDIRNEQLPHGVSMVKTDKIRLSITAWFCDKPQES